MSFLSGAFLLFFPVVTVVYFSLPQRLRWGWLLFASYFFYMSWNPWYGLLLFSATGITYLSGRLIGRAGALPDARRAAGIKKAAVAVSFVCCLGILSAFKYLRFFSGLFADALSLFGIAAAPVDLGAALPVGISFYTFQALTYPVDVYRGDVRPQRHFGKYALYVSFFPQLVSGPIEKSKEMLAQFDEEHRFDYNRVRRGLLFMLWGYFEKMVVADRLAVPVNTVFSSPGKYAGPQVAVAAVFFALEIYCDFAGYSNIAVGAAQVLGFRMNRNFDRPYFSLSIRDFWRRWHITLGSWFRDYLYIPLGGNRCSRARHCWNLFVVFAVCGLWHGASLTFVVWGALHGLYQIFGVLLKPAGRRISEALRFRPDSAAGRLARGLFTFALVDFAWIFFRAATFSDAFTLIGGLFRPADPAGGALFSLGLTPPEFAAALAGIAVVLLVDWCGERTDVRSLILNRNTAFRWSFYLAAALVILIFGIYGSEYTAQQFIYQQF